MRLFLAIPLPDDVRRGLAGAVETAAVAEPRHFSGGRKVKWVRPENLHVTLKFLGEVAEADVGSLVADLDRVPKRGPFELRTAGLELFPPRGPVRVIAAKVEGELERLLPLHRSIDQVGEDHGVPPEGRAFRPHVTLGRARPGGDAMDRYDVMELCGLDRLPQMSFAVDAFALYASQLLPDGPRYTVVRRFPFAAGV